MVISTPLTELLGIEHPILLAPMAGVSGGALAAAVTSAGGLGILGGGYGDANWIQTQVEATGNQRIGIGFITWSLARQPELLDRALAHGPAAIMLSFGEIDSFASKVKDAGAHLICQVQSVADARAVAAQGADVIVAQGTEAGGHGATRSTLPLVPAVVDAVAPIPVVAAGGIADGRGLAAALMLGAAGVLMGSRFYVSREALAADTAKEHATGASGDATLRSSLPDIARRIDWPAQFTIRTLRNPFIDRWYGKDLELRVNEAEKDRYVAARDAGDIQTAAVILGEVVDLIRDVPTAGDILRRVVGDAESLLDGGWRKHWRQDM